MPIHIIPPLVIATLAAAINQKTMQEAFFHLTMLTSSPLKTAATTKTFIGNSRKIPAENKVEPSESPPSMRKK